MCSVTNDNSLSVWQWYRCVLFLNRYVFVRGTNARAKCRCTFSTNLEKLVDTCHCQTHSEIHCTQNIKWMQFKNNFVTWIKNNFCLILPNLTSWMWQMQDNEMYSSYVHQGLWNANILVVLAYKICWAPL